MAFRENSYFWDFSFQAVVCDETETYSTDTAAILGNIVDLDRRDKGAVIRDNALDNAE